eukprot:1871772-Prymnesium_polylepis.1
MQKLQPSSACFSCSRDAMAAERMDEGLASKLSSTARWNSASWGSCGGWAIGPRRSCRRPAQGRAALTCHSEKKGLSALQ